MEPSELVSLLLILFFFFAAIISPILQQLRSAARKRKREARARQQAAESKGSKVSEGSEGRSDAQAKRGGRDLLSRLRRGEPGDTRETNAYRDLLREDDNRSRLRFGEGPESGTESRPEARSRETAAAESAAASRSSRRSLRGAAEQPLSSAWTEADAAPRGSRGRAGAAARRPHAAGSRRRGFSRIRALPPLQRGVIMAELLGKPKALRDEPFER